MEKLVKLLFPRTDIRCNKRQLEQAIKKLPLDNKTAITLHFLKGISKKTIASQLNWSLSKVNTKITRGITLLKHELNPGYYKQMEEILSRQITAASGNDWVHS